MTLAAIVSTDLELLTKDSILGVLRAMGAQHSTRSAISMYVQLCTPSGQDFKETSVLAACDCLKSKK